ncbi:hypothetical protein SDC9_74808 [bioreactor metagenome]|uniref:Uncharacterized protein n=1 Tax=bioreactor metagenome TaxID=1076179 RepID=A0A644YJV1_9ZZZZ
MVCHIWIFHIGPKSDRAGKILPHTLIFPYAFLAFVYKRNQAVFFNLILAVQSQLFFDLKLYGKSVSVPSGLSEHFFALHGLISWNHILYNSRQHMSDVWLSVCCRRTVIKGICFALFAVFNAFFEYPVFAPEFFDFLFPLGKIKIRGYFIVHFILTSRLFFCLLLFCFFCCCP